MLFVLLGVISLRAKQDAASVLVQLRDIQEDWKVYRSELAVDGWRTAQLHPELETDS